MTEKSRFDCSGTDLLCNEELNDDLNFQSFDEENETGGSDSTPLIHLPCLSEECIGWMLERERKHLPKNDYISRFTNGELDVSLRREALDSMFKACAFYNFGELSLYTAVSYFDRFLSVYKLPAISVERGDKTWAIQLVSVACLSLAAKIEEVNVPSTVDLQAGEPKYLFEAKTIQRMEIVVLNYLKWNIKAYTPFSFIDYYLRKMNNGEFPSGNLINKSVQIILNTTKVIDFLEFRPSEIAAAVAIYVSGEIQAIHIDKALSSLVGVEKERVVKCIELIQDLSSNNEISSSSYITTSNANVARASASSSVPHSPIGVLDASFYSYKSEERTVGSCPSSSQNSPQTKRRKLNQNQ
ncbi:hypothetical protein ACJIZ3_002542 [Penstemon smallii]|uniref:Uncharacterized protein n=1 Tax=Penstemon smallii TaxID=265156 RepID=A0ABD3U6P4_9LAMI